MTEQFIPAPGFVLGGEANPGPFSDGVRRQWGYVGEAWVFDWWFVHWRVWSLGVSVNIDGLDNTHVQLHLPFGFLTIGRKFWGNRVPL